MENLLKVKEKKTIKTDQLNNKYVTFLIGDEIYSIEVLRVKEVFYMMKITEVITDLPFLKGVVDLRGTIVPLVDARVKFQKTVKTYDDNTVIIIMEFQNLLLGMIVDSVLDVANLIVATDKVENEDTKEAGKNYIKKIIKNKDDLVIMLDVDNMFSKFELEKMQQLK